MSSPTIETARAAIRRREDRLKISAANFNFTQAETIAAIREMGLMCVRVSESQFLIDYPHGDLRRIDGDKGTACCADSLAAAYERALVLRDWGWGFYRLAKRRRAVAAAAAASNA